MKSFLFESIWLLSRAERRARLIQFHPQKNLFVGRNHTGKSTLIKALYLTLGARPSGALGEWDESAVSVVDFRIDGKRYRAVHQLRHRALFNDANELIVATTDHQKWTESFSQIVEFNLVLTDKNLKTTPADPRCFFLPFYINQDGSWQSTWNTFVGIQQYKAPAVAILEYFGGIKPPEYYRLSSKRTQNQRMLEDLQKERVFLDRARRRFGESISLTAPKLHHESFNEEIASLVREVTELNKKQESLREKSVREEELLRNIQQQIDLASAALFSYEGDSSFMVNEPTDRLTCPTCGAEHSQPFIDFLTFAEDARILRELVAKLREDAIKASDQYRKTVAERNALETHYAKVSDVLSVRRGDLQFSDVVDSMGAERALHVFEEQHASLKIEIDKHLSEIEILESALKDLTDKKRSSEILQIFREEYSSALNTLNVPPIDTTKLRLTSRPDISGSGGPRSILAYYGALWRTCLGPNGSFSIPLVVDAPNQQGQDDINLPRVLKFVATELPNNAQVIVASEMDTEHIFDNKVVLDEPYRLLLNEEYDDAIQAVEPLVTTMYASLQDTTDL